MLPLKCTEVVEEGKADAGREYLPAFSYEVDTKTGPLSLSLHERAETWKEAYEALKKEVKAENISVPAFSGNTGKKPPYFFTGMQENERTKQG